MKSLFTSRNAATALLLVFAVVFVFHLLILFGVVSSQEIWGGQVPNDLVIYFEFLALGILILFSYIIASKSGLLKWKSPHFINKYGSWVVFTYLLINTLGNLLGSGQEKLFALVTLFLSICAFMVASKK